MPSFAPGNRSSTASAMTWAVGVAHRVDGRVRAGVEQLVRRAALRRVERRLLVVDRGRRAACPLSSAIASPPGNHKNLSSRQDERSDLPRFHPPSRSPRIDGGGALSVPR